MLRFVVDGDPVAQPRVTPSRFAGKAYVPKEHPVHAFRDAARWAAIQAARDLDWHPDGNPVELVVVFVRARPKRLVWKTKPMPRVWCPVKPDLDNLVKSLKDALKGVAWADDCSVCRTVQEKFYAAAHEGPHVEVTIRRIA